MELMVISIGDHGGAIRVRQSLVRRRSRLGASAGLFAFSAIVAGLSIRDEACAQPAPEKPVPPSVASGRQSPGSASRKVTTRPGAPAPLPRATSAAPVRSKPGPTPEVPAPAPHPLANKRFKVRDELGECVVARFHGQYGDKTALILPDGQLGTPNRLVPTDEPFRALTADQLEAVLRSGPFAEYHLLRTKHYLIFYKSTLTFAQDSGRVLDSLYDGLLVAFRRHGFPVHESEFPLVAVIFATESDFRAHKQVDPQVQAYYEFFTNRIFFYEKSDRDLVEPKIATFLKPQTVAHEGTHQVLSNIGLQPRPCAWPLWLVEGLAEYCATTVSSKKGIVWSGMGAINSLHMATLRELDDPLSSELNDDVRPLKVAHRRVTNRTEALLLKTALTPTDYADAWALTHYLALALKRGEDFVKFLKAMSQLSPLEPRTPRQNLAEFRRFFSDDLSKLDKKLDDYVRKLSQKKGYDPLPYYTVIFAQPLGNGVVRRAATYSQSPQMIQQWVDEMTAPQGGEPNWEVVQRPTRARAILAAQEWMRGD